MQKKKKFSHFTYFKCNFQLSSACHHHKHGVQRLSWPKRASGFKELRLLATVTCWADTAARNLKDWLVTLQKRQKENTAWIIVLNIARICHGLIRWTKTLNLYSLTFIFIRPLRWSMCLDFRFVYVLWMCAILVITCLPCLRVPVFYIGDYTCTKLEFIQDS